MLPLSTMELCLLISLTVMLCELFFFSCCCRKVWNYWLLLT